MVKRPNDQQCSCAHLGETVKETNGSVDSRHSTSGSTTARNAAILASEFFVHTTSVLFLIVDATLDCGCCVRLAGSKN